MLDSYLVLDLGSSMSSAFLLLGCIPRVVDPTNFHRVWLDGASNLAAAVGFGCAGYSCRRFPLRLLCAGGFIFSFPGFVYNARDHRSSSTWQTVWSVVSSLTSLGSYVLDNYDLCRGIVTIFFVKHPSKSDG